MKGWVTSGHLSLSPMVIGWVKGWVESPMLGCVTRGSRNLSVAIQTDDAVIWVTGGSAARRGICCMTFGHTTPITYGDSPPVIGWGDVITPYRA